MSKQSGIALILVLAILPLVAIIMVQLHFETTIGDRLARNVLANQQFKQAIHARRRHMQLRLVADLVEDEKSAQEGGALDHYSDEWGPETEGGGTSTTVKKGDAEQGDEIELYTEVIDEQGKFNLNLLRHSDPATRGLALERLKRLLNYFRDDDFGDFEDSEYDLSEAEANDVGDQILKFVQGEERDERIPKSELPPATADMKQGLLTVEDLVFCHKLFLEKKLHERFTDLQSNQVLPSLFDFVTLHGDGKVNANTASIQVLRSMFKEAQGSGEVANAILNTRGGFLKNEEQQEERLNKYNERQDAKENQDEDKLAQLDTGYKNVNDITTNVEGMNDGPFLRRNNIDVGRDFTVRSNFFTLIITAKRDNFLRQQRLILERHNRGVITWESEVRTVDVNTLPEGIPGLEEGQDRKEQ